MDAAFAYIAAHPEIHEVILTGGDPFVLSTRRIAAITVRLAANGNTDIELIAPQDARIRSAGVAGFIRPIDQSEGGKYDLACSGRSCDGATFQITTDQPNPINFLVIGAGPLPPSAAPLLSARPKFAEPQYNPDASIAFAHVRL